MAGANDGHHTRGAGCDGGAGQGDAQDCVGIGSGRRGGGRGAGDAGLAGSHAEALHVAACDRIQLARGAFKVILVVFYLSYRSTNPPIITPPHYPTGKRHLQLEVKEAMRKQLDGESAADIDDIEAEAE